MSANPKNLRGLEMLMRMFTRMAYIGVAVIVVGVVGGVFVPGSAEGAVIGACVGLGGMMLFAGLRGRKRGHEAFARLRGDPPLGWP